MTHDVQRDPQSVISRRTFAQGLAVAASATVAGASGALAQQSSAVGAADDDHHPAARFRPRRRADHLFLGPRYHRGRSVLQRPRPAQRARSSASTPDCCGPKARRGARRAAISCGATFPTIGRCDGRRTTVASACSARRPTTPTATRSTSRAGSSPASISPDGSCATSTTAPSTVLADNFNGKKLNSPNDVVAHPDGSYWFTDPPYGGQLYEGEPDAAGGPAMRPASSIRGSASRPASCRASASCRPTAIVSIPAAGSTSW